MNKTITVTTLLTVEQKKKLDEYAKEDERSVSGMVRKIIIEYINYREAH